MRYHMQPAIEAAYKLSQELFKAAQSRREEEVNKELFDDMHELQMMIFRLKEIRDMAPTPEEWKEIAENINKEREGLPGWKPYE